jgi:hypothetical protein
MITIGAVWFFNRSVTTGVWSQMGPKVSPTGTAGTSNFGRSCSLNYNGTIAVVGGHSDAGFLGATWVISLYNGVWAQQGPKLVGQGYVVGSNNVWQGYASNIASINSNVFATGTITHVFNHSLVPH